MKRKVNTLTRWPYVHICFLDLSCWCEWWLYGMPMRIHYKKDWFWTVPGPTLWISNYRNKILWTNAVEVHVTGPSDTPSESG